MGLGWVRSSVDQFQSPLVVYAVGSGCPNRSSVVQETIVHCIKSVASSSGQKYDTSVEYTLGFTPYDSRDVPGASRGPIGIPGGKPVVDHARITGAAAAASHRLYLCTTRYVCLTHS